MSDREDLHAILVGVLGSPNVYFQPPPNKEIIYPCIVYKRNKGVSKFAANNPYKFNQGYLITLITKDPDSPIFSDLAALPSAEFRTHHVADGLNHDVFSYFTM